MGVGGGPDKSMYTTADKREGWPVVGPFWALEGVLIEGGMQVCRYAPAKPFSWLPLAHAYNS